ncbi:MAG: sulfatase-like hydrolase/transferase [Nitrososphaeria archaeon]
MLKEGKFRELLNLYRASKERIKLSSNYPVDKGGNWITWLIRRISLETPFFIFINFMEMHDPYPSDVKYPPNEFHLNDLFGIKKIDEGLMRKIRREYFEQSKIADLYFGRILDAIKEVYDNTLIILTSDHGQALKEKGYYGHGIFLYDELVKIPMIVKYPNAYKPKNDFLISLTNIYHFIKSAVEGDYELKKEDLIFSESYGIQDSIENIQIDEKTRKIYDAPRKAIFKNGYKLVVNGFNGSIEEFTFKGKPVNDKNEILKEMLEDLYVYKGNEKFVINGI